MPAAFRQIFDRLQPIFLVASILLVAAGMKFSGNDLSSPWSSPNFYALGTWLAISCTALILIRIGIPKYAGLAAILFILAILLVGAGLASSLVCLVFLISIFSVGKLALSYFFNPKDHTAIWLQTLIIGFCFYILIIGLMIHFPVNYPWSYAAILIAPIAALIYKKDSRQQCLADIKRTITSINISLSKIAYWKLSCLLILIGFVGIYSFLPSITSDDNSYHLAMWSQLKTQHKFLFDVKTQIWSTAPFTLDMMHGFISVMAMMDARGSLNIILLLLLMLAILDLSRSVFTSHNQVLLSLALFASTPLLTNLMLGLQTEILLALLTTLGACIINKKELSFINKIILVFLISCILVSIKLPATLIALSLVIGLFIVEWRNLNEFRQLGTAGWLKLFFFAIMGCTIAFHSYINAYLITGNPTFPLYNGIFKSPFYYPTNFKDETFTHGANLNAYLGLFFNSSKYFESYNFIAGFQYLILPFFGAFYLFMHNRKNALCLVLPIAFYGAVMFYLMQYLRYLFPILPLACILAAAAFRPPTAVIYASFQRIVSIGIFCIYLLLNIHYLPAVSWLLKNNPFDNLTAAGKIATMQSYSAETALNVYMNKNHPGESVLFEMDRSLGATLWAKPYYLAWISPSTLADFDKMKNADDCLEYLKQNKIRFIYRYEEPIPNSFYFRDFIKEVITQHGTKELVAGNMTLYKINY